MSLENKLHVEIIYCVPWSYHAEAAWMANEFFAECGNGIALTLTPGESGVLKVIADGDIVYDKSQEDDKHPDLGRVKEMRAALKSKLK